jgi:hypothetical protein
MFLDLGFLEDSIFSLFLSVICGLYCVIALKAYFFYKFLLPKLLFCLKEAIFGMV